jgi:hypothetical protein
MQWESWPTTLRWPTSDDPSATSQPDVLENQLQNNGLTIRDRTYNLLTQATTYEAFSNDGFAGPQSDPRWYDSLESIHNQVRWKPSFIGVFADSCFLSKLHGLTGGNGHMGVVDYAAFDPVFYLHHTNVSFAVSFYLLLTLTYPTRLIGYLRFGKVGWKKVAHFGSMSDSEIPALNPDSYVIPRPNQWVTSLSILWAPS